MISNRAAGLAGQNVVLWPFDGGRLRGLRHRLGAVDGGAKALRLAVGGG